MLEVGLGHDATNLFRFNECFCHMFTVVKFSPFSTFLISFIFLFVLITGVKIVYLYLIL